MVTRQIFDVITKVAASGCEYENPRSDEVFTALMHGYLYVRPGKDTEHFSFVLEEEFQNSEIAGAKMYAEHCGMVSLNDCLQLAAISRGKRHVMNFFDKEYFEQQSSIMAGDEAYDEKLFINYMKKFDKETMLNFFKLIVSLKNVEKGSSYFMSGFNSKDMLFALNAECRRVDQSVPVMRAGIQDKAYTELITQRPFYFFDVLDIKTIAKILVQYIDQNKIMAGHIAKMLFYTDVETARKYTIIALYCEEQLGMDLFNPVILVDVPPSEEWADVTWDVPACEEGNPQEFTF